MSTHDLQSSPAYLPYPETLAKSHHAPRVLGEIKNINGAIETIMQKKKEQSVRSGELSIKKAPIRGSANKENFKDIDDNVLKLISYGNMNRSIQEKIAIIEHQKSEIAALKECVNNIHHNGTVKQKEQAKLREQRQRARQEQIKRLRQQERQHSQTLKELQGMRGHIKEIKRKYDTVVSQKQTLMEKYSRLLGQNQELTLVISKLKQQISTGACNQYALGLEQELAMLQLDLKQSQNQRESSESRCVNFQKRMNEYILKYNQMHSNFGQFQIKYYKMQKDCDNLRVDRDELELRANNNVNQLTAERQIHEKEMALLKGKLKRYEEQLMQRDSVLLQLRKTDNEGENILLQLSDTVKRLQDEIKVLREQKEQQTKKWQKYVKQLMKQCAQQKESKLYNCKQQFQEILIKSHQQNILLKQQHERYVTTITRQVQQLSDSLTQTKQRNAVLEEQLRRNQQIIGQNNSQIEQRQRKCEYYISEITSRNNLLKQKQQEIQALEEDIEQHLKQQQQILNKIDQLEKQINEGKINLHQQNQTLLKENQTLKQQMAETARYYQQKQTNANKQIQKICQEKEEAITCLRQYRENKTITNSQKQQLKKHRQQQTKQKRYYQQKYERQLQQYNELSSHFRQLQSENDRLLKQNANNIVQISNLKGDLLQLKTEIDNYSSSQPQNQPLEQTYNQFQTKYYQSQNKCNLYLLKIEQLDLCLTELRQDMQILRQTHHNLNTKYQTVLNRNQQLDQLFKSLQNKVSTSVQFAQNLKSSQTTELSNLKNRLRLTEEEAFAASRAITQKDILIAKIKTQLELQVQEIRYLTQSVNTAQGKYISLVQQYNIDAAQWDQLKQKWRQYAEARQSEKKMMHNSRISANYELDSSQNAIEILRQQNRQLQRIFGVEIERRNGTIRELIKEKKILFSQLIEKSL